MIQLKVSVRSETGAKSVRGHRRLIEWVMAEISNGGDARPRMQLTDEGGNVICVLQIDGYSLSSLNEGLRITDGAIDLNEDFL